MVRVWKRYKISLLANTQKTAPKLKEDNPEALTALFWILIALLFIYAIVRTKFRSTRTIFANIHGLFGK